MIDFDCLCRRYRFSVPAELAGDTIQCPECKRLNDIPTPEEAAQLESDGGYKIDLIPDAKELDSDLAIRAFSRARLDDHGEIDMRQTFDDVLRAGVHPAHGTYENPKRVAPRYDPFTGELIVPLTIKDETPQRVIALEDDPDEQPLEAVPITPKLEYSRAHVRSTTVAMASAFIDLLTVGNITVMFFIWLAHLLIFPMQFGGIAAIIAIFAVNMAIFAHYGNVVDEIGPADRDELPVMLRSVSIGEDIWRPFVGVITSLFVSFVPMLLIQWRPLPKPIDAIAFDTAWLLGCFVSPVILLTMITSGAYANFRPDRLVAVVKICGMRYLIAASTLTGAIALYIPAVLLTANGFASFVTSPGILSSMGRFGTGALLFAGAVYLTHAAAWQIGLLYRAYHQDFPWILQRHVYTRLGERNRPAPVLPATPIKEAPHVHAGLR